MIHPVPRPALRKSPDANVHPAAPGRPGLRLAPADRPAAAGAAPAAVPKAAPAPPAPPTSKSPTAKAQPATGGHPAKADPPQPDKQKGSGTIVKSGKTKKGDKSGKSGKHADPAPSQPPASKAGAPATGSRLSGPLAGRTSDSLRASPKRQRAGKKAPVEKLVDLRVKVPKALRKDLHSAAKSNGRSEDEIVAALLRGWLGD